MWHDILVAIALLLVLEGVLPFVSPGALRATLLRIVQMNDSALRFAGLTSMLVGVLLLNLLN